MNPTEQRQRRTAATRITRQLADVQTLVVALDDRVVEVARTTLAAINDERTGAARFARVTSDAINAERRYVDDHLEQWRAFLSCSLWQRLRWICVGR